MVDLHSKNMSALILILTIFNYFIPIVPEIYKFNVTLIGFFLSIVVYFESKVKNRLIRPLFYKILTLLKLCSSEKYFRLLYVKKTGIIEKNGYGKITIIYKLLNESGLKKRYIIKIESTNNAFTKSLKQMELENKFEVKSLDGNPLKLETISDSTKFKEFYILFDRDLEPGETREFMVRYESECLFRTKKSQLNAGEKEKISSIPIHVTDLVKIKIHFGPGYECSELRYCVKSPSKDELQGKCKYMESEVDTEIGGRYVEIEEKDPWRNFEYSIDWIPEN